VKNSPRDPLALTDWVIVDGSNLLHALTRGADRTPAAALIGRLRGLIPGDITIDLVFDGPAERSLRGERIASGLRVRYSGPRSGDDLILALVDEMRVTAGPESTGTILVVSDDRDLRDRLRARGARSAGTSWLIGRLERGRIAAPSSGNPRPRRTHGPMDDDDSPSGWEPGRGATSKRGPSRRAPKRERG
jgi:hypothetical protein